MKSFTYLLNLEVTCNPRTSQYLAVVPPNYVGVCSIVYVLEKSQINLNFKKTKLVLFVTLTNFND